MQYHKTFMYSLSKNRFQWHQKRHVLGRSEQSLFQRQVVVTPTLSSFTRTGSGAVTVAVCLHSSANYIVARSSLKKGTWDTLVDCTGIIMHTSPILYSLPLLRHLPALRLLLYQCAPLIVIKIPTIWSQSSTMAFWQHFQVRSRLLMVMNGVDDTNHRKIIPLQSLKKNLPTRFPLLLYTDLPTYLFNNYVPSISERKAFANSTFKSPGETLSRFGKTAVRIDSATIFRLPVYSVYTFTAFFVFKSSRSDRRGP